MKKLFLSIVAIASFTTALNAQIRYGLEAGLNMANEYISASAGGMSPSMLPGGRAGVLLDCAAGDHLSIQTGLYFSMEGYKFDAGGVSLTTSIFYGHLPLEVVYKMDKGPGKFFVAAGPYLAYAFKGTEKFSGGGMSGSTDIKFGTDSTDARPLSYGIGANLGYELPSGLLFRAGYDFGLANLSNGPGGTATNYTIHVTVGWLFGTLSTGNIGLFSGGGNKPKGRRHNVVAFP